MIQKKREKREGELMAKKLFEVLVL